MSTPTRDDTLTVLYDGGCPLCRREIAHVQRLVQGRSDAGLCFVDVSAGRAPNATTAAAAAASATAGVTEAVAMQGATRPVGPLDDAERAALLARFHVQRADGSRLDGAAAFVAMWQRLPGWRWLARLASWPGMLALMEWAYRGFLRVRPALQSLARRWEPTPGLSLHLERELRSDHAGETGAVCIYRGIATVAAWRGNAALAEFARRHGETEAEHLQLIEAWLPPHRRSRLLGPWRLAGWLTGALPALAGPRAVHATIAAVETFVDRHYQQQIDHIARHGAPEGLLPLLQRCQADECEHRDEARALAGPRVAAWLRAWCAIVGHGSAAAVVVARRF